MLLSKYRSGFSIGCLKRGGKMLSINIKISNLIRSTMNSKKGYKLTIKNKRCLGLKGRKSLPKKVCFWTTGRHTLSFRDIR